MIDGCREHRLNLFFTADVCLDRKRPPSAGFDSVCHLLRGCGVDDIVDDDVGARRGKTQRNRLPDPGIRAGHQGGLSLQDDGEAAGGTLPRPGSRMRGRIGGRFRHARLPQVRESFLRLSLAALSFRRAFPTACRDG
jgi:hypothetical protein